MSIYLLHTCRVNWWGPREGVAEPPALIGIYRALDRIFSDKYTQCIGSALLWSIYFCTFWQVAKYKNQD